MSTESNIPYEYRKYGQLFTLRQRSGRVVLYASKNPDSGEARGFEVMVIQNRPAAVLNGKFFPACEALPSSSHWGVFGWSFLPTEEKRAIDKFANVCKRFNPKPIRKLVRVKRESWLTDSACDGK